MVREHLLENSRVSIINVTFKKGILVNTEESPASFSSLQVVSWRKDLGCD